MTRPAPRLPARLLLPVQEFIRTETAGGLVLLAAAAIALVWANSPFSDSYFDFWHTEISIETGIFDAREDLQHWVNDGLMTIFFLVVGLEIKRELLRGELAGLRLAALPAAAAIGGMVVPALLYTALNAGGDGGRGWGIPMATDIAFALGVLALVGRGIPSALRSFLLALAIVDDIGAIGVIAVFYTDDLALDALTIALGLTIVIAFLRALDVQNGILHGALGVALWAAAFESGIHPTIAGVVLGLLTPVLSAPDPDYARTASGLLDQYESAVETGDVARAEAALGELEEETALRSSPLERLERLLHPWSSFVIVPIFALANAGVELSGSAISDAAESSITHGVIIGLLAGKVIGIVAATYITVRLGLGDLPRGATWPHIIGLGLLAGIGFTVALFIAGLAFDDPQQIDQARIGILTASAVAGVIGFLALRHLAARHGEEAASKGNEA
jgi:NhaA family Na+:H+ antiporter